MEIAIRRLAELNERAKSLDFPGWSHPYPGASEAEMREAEQAIMRELPSDLRILLKFSRSWMWREKGFDAVIFQAPKDISEDYFKPDEVMDQVAVSSASSVRVKPYFYSDKRLTIAFSDYFKFQIDEDPGPLGVFGQIVVVDTDAETIDVIADSLAEFVNRGADCLESQLSGGYPAERK